MSFSITKVGGGGGERKGVSKAERMLDIRNELEKWESDKRVIKRKDHNYRKVNREEDSDVGCEEDKCIGESSE